MDTNIYPGDGCAEKIPSLALRGSQESLLDRELERLAFVNFVVFKDHTKG